MKGDGDWRPPDGAGSGAGGRNEEPKCDDIDGFMLLIWGLKMKGMDGVDDGGDTVSSFLLCEGSGSV